VVSQNGTVEGLMLPDSTDTEPAADMIYAPILKWKEGEQLALRDLRIPLDAMRPVIELVRRPRRPNRSPRIWPAGRISWARTTVSDAER
jgi:hypothetical protein